MDAEDFFNRWSNRKKPGEIPTEPAVESTEPISQNSDQDEQPKPLTLPTAQDVAQLHDDSDFSVYMNQNVDESVKNLAMKKLFTNPHFNVMDGLDIYISDYSQPDPIPPAMLASLRHAQELLNPLQHLEQVSQRLLDKNHVAALDEGLAPTTDVPAIEPPPTVAEAEQTKPNPPTTHSAKDAVKDTGVATDKDQDEHQN